MHCIEIDKAEVSVREIKERKHKIKISSSSSSRSSAFKQRREKEKTKDGQNENLEDLLFHHLSLLKLPICLFFSLFLIYLFFLSLFPSKFCTPLFPCLLSPSSLHTYHTIIFCICTVSKLCFSFLSLKKKFLT